MLLLFFSIFSFFFMIFFGRHRICVVVKIRISWRGKCNGNSGAVHRLLSFFFFSSLQCSKENPYYWLTGYIVNFLGTFTNQTLNPFLSYWSSLCVPITIIILFLLTTHVKIMIWLGNNQMADDFSLSPFFYENVLQQVSLSINIHYTNVWRFVLYIFFLLFLLF